MSRALAALRGLAVGDALGMPTQTFSRAEVARRWPGLSGFVAGPPDSPVCPGRPAGSVTDDTEQALLVARLLVEDGRVDPRRLAEALVQWEADVAARGSLDLLGPSTRRAVRALAAGADPATTGRGGDTNGSAMRIPPVGIAVPPEPLARLVEAVVETGRPTHHTSSAHAAACAVAAAISAGVDGADVPRALELARAAAAAGAASAAIVTDHPRKATVIGRDDPGDLPAVLDRALHLVRTASSAADALDALVREVGTSLLAVQSVPTALALAARHPDDAWAAGLAAASLGGDTDTIGAIACAVVAACGGSLPAPAVHTVTRVNGLDLEPVVDGLLARRAAASWSPT